MGNENVVEVPLVQTVEKIVQTPAPVYGGGYGGVGYGGGATVFETVAPTVYGGGYGGVGYGGGVSGGGAIVGGVIGAPIVETFGTTTMAAPMTTMAAPVVGTSYGKTKKSRIMVNTSTRSIEKKDGPYNDY